MIGRGGASSFLISFPIFCDRSAFPHSRDTPRCEPIALGDTARFFFGYPAFAGYASRIFGARRGGKGDVCGGISWRHDVRRRAIRGVTKMSRSMRWHKAEKRFFVDEEGQKSTFLIQAI